MKFSAALKHAKSGARIRRELWDSFLIWRDNALHWDLPKSLLRQCFEHLDGSSRYGYWEPDELACDWIVEKAAVVRQAA